MNLYYCQSTKNNSLCSLTMSDYQVTESDKSNNETINLILLHKAGDLHYQGTGSIVRDEQHKIW